VIRGEEGDTAIHRKKRQAGFFVEEKGRRGKESSIPWPRMKGKEGGRAIAAFTLKRRLNCTFFLTTRKEGKSERNNSPRL